MADIVQLIAAKRDGKALSRDQIREFVQAYSNDEIPDYQASAFLMAAFCRGMTAAETSALTFSMLRSGTMLNFSDIPGPKIDKHSTGGVGDKISLILAPLVACCGLIVPMISGRGLGHTGGTRDKMEAIPGVRTDLTIEELHAQLQAIGVAIIGQTADIAPADKRLYALRDVTATVESIPFISASIMSKKLAEGLDGLVLDVKCGRGAFMKTEKEARSLAETMVSIGHDCGVPTTALLTAMDVPLGRAIGNWIEVEESIRCLRGEGEPDVLEVTLALAAEMLWLNRLVPSREAGYARAQAVLDSGQAYERFAEMAQQQGGYGAVIREPHRYVRRASKTVILAPATARGFVADIDAGALGWIATGMGVGRAVKEDAVDPDAGMFLHLRPGEFVEPGMPLVSFYTRKADEVGAISQAIVGAYSFAPEPPMHRPVIMDRLYLAGWQSQAATDGQSPA